MPKIGLILAFSPMEGRGPDSYSGGNGADYYFVGGNAGNDVIRDVARQSHRIAVADNDNQIGGWHGAAFRFTTGRAVA